MTGIGEVPLFTAEYGAANASMARTELNQRLIADLGRCFNAARKVLPEQTQDAEQSLQAARPDRRLPGALFLWQQELLGALRAGNVSYASEALAAISGAAREPSLEPGGDFRVASIVPGSMMTEALKDISIKELFPEMDEAEASRMLESGVLFDPAPQAAYPAWISEACELANLADPEILREVNELVHEVQVFDGPGPSLSSTRTFGVVFIASPGPEYNPVHYMLEHLTHEASHHMLFALMAFDPMLDNPDSGRYMSPVRADPRPLYGILHQVYVISRLVRMWSLLLQHNQRWAEVRLKYDLGRYSGAIEVLDAHASLTGSGDILLRTCREMVKRAVS